MKRKQTFGTFMVAIVATMLMLFSSCSQQDDLAYAAKVDYNKSPLLEDLRKVNTSLIEERAQTRGWSTAQWLQVTVADIRGAYKGGKNGGKIGKYIGSFFGRPVTGTVCGALIGGSAYGAYKSYKAAPEGCALTTGTTGDVSVPQLSMVCYAVADDNLSANGNNFDANFATMKRITPDDELLSSVSLSQQQLNVGKMHNVILASIDHSIKVKDADISEKDSLFTAIWNSDQMQNLLVSLEATSSEDDKLTSKADSVMNLFEDLFLQYTAEDKDVVYIINKYSELINSSSELTDDEKDWILSGLATALYSYNFWNVTLNDK